MARERYLDATFLYNNNVGIYNMKNLNIEYHDQSCVLGVKD